MKKIKILFLLAGLSLSSMGFGESNSLNCLKNCLKKIPNFDEPEKILSPKVFFETQTLPLLAADNLNLKNLSDRMHCFFYETPFGDEFEDNTYLDDSEKDILSMVVPAGTDIDFELPEGEMSAECFETITNICNMTNPSSILEIGFRRGNSALMWLLNSSATLLSVDIEEFPAKSIQLLESTFKDRFSYLQCDSQNLNLDSTYDLIFIDGDHTGEGVLNDIVSYKKKIKKNSIIIFDDYNQEKFPELVDVVNEFVSKEKIRRKYILHTTFVVELDN